MKFDVYLLMTSLQYTGAVIAVVVTGLLYIAYRRKPKSNRPSLLEEIKQIVYTNQLKLNEMATKAEFEAAFQVVTDALNNIGDDITRLTEQLQDGSLTEAEEADVLAQLTALGDRAKEIAGRTPEQQEPTEPVEPTEPTEPTEPEA